MLQIEKSKTREFIESLSIAVVATLFIVVFVLQFFLVKGSSMDNTLADGERLLVNKLVYYLRTPKTGDIVVLKYPKDPKVKFIKRVIALPGESIYVENGKLYVDGYEVTEKYIAEKMITDFDFEVVPDNCVFVMGDNRNYSKDSRDHDVGFVPYKNIVGKAAVVVWPLNKVKILTKPVYELGKPHSMFDD